MKQKSFSLIILENRNVFTIMKNQNGCTSSSYIVINHIYRYNSLRYLILMSFTTTENTAVQMKCSLKYNDNE